jgi:PAS domain S-box-containing protein
MSVVATQSEVLTSAPSMSNGWLVSEGSPGHPRDAAGMGGNRRVERRNGGSGGSPMDILTQLPAVVVMERLPVPSVAMARDGIILFANTAFAEMVGYPQDSLAGLAFPATFHTLPAAVAALSSVNALANLIVQLRHFEGWTVQARMSKSATMRRDDPVALVTFENLTERLWNDER